MPVLHLFSTNINAIMRTTTIAAGLHCNDYTV